MIKHFVLIIALAFSCLSYAQNDISSKFELSPLSEIMLKKYYSDEQIKELYTNEVKLKMLDYYYSKSFEVLPNQVDLKSKISKVDVNNLRLKRLVSESVIIYDEVSGLNLKLVSLEEMEANYKKINPKYKTNKELEIKNNNN